MKKQFLKQSMHPLAIRMLLTGFIQKIQFSLIPTVDVLIQSVQGVSKFQISNQRIIHS